MPHTTRVNHGESGLHIRYVNGVCTKGCFRYLKKRILLATSTQDLSKSNKLSYFPISDYYQNCRGLRNKFLNVKCNVLSFNYHFIVLTET